MDKDKKLFMSVKIPDTNDIVPGYGAKELLISLVAAGVGLIIGLLLYVMSANLSNAVIVGVLLVVVTILLIVRDQCNESLIDKIGFMIKYFKEQKHYEFKFYDEMKVELKKLEDTHDSK